MLFRTQGAFLEDRGQVRREHALAPRSPNEVAKASA